MNKILLVLSLLISLTDAIAAPVMEDGSTHTTVFNIRERLLLQPGEDTGPIDHVLPQVVAGNSVWTSAKACLFSLPGAGVIDIDPLNESDRVIIQTWIVNSDIDALLGSYYFNYEIKSWQGEACSPLEVFANPVHLLHNVHVGIRMYNAGTTSAMGKVSIIIYAK